MFKNTHIYLFALMMLVLSSAVGCSAKRGFELAKQGATDFHHEYNASRFAGIYRGSGKEIRDSMDEMNCITLFQDVQEHLGAISDAKLIGERYNIVLDGTVVSLQFNTRFERGRAIEDLAFRIAD